MKIREEKLRKIIHEEIKSLDEKGPKIKKRKYKGKEYKAIPGMKKYKKKGGGYSLSKCISDLEGSERAKKKIDNPGAVCMAAKIAHTGTAKHKKKK